MKMIQSRKTTKLSPKKAWLAVIVASAGLGVLLQRLGYFQGYKSDFLLLNTNDVSMDFPQVQPNEDRRKNSEEAPLGALKTNAISLSEQQPSIPITDDNKHESWREILRQRRQKLQQKQQPSQQSKPQPSQEIPAGENGIASHEHQRQIALHQQSAQTMRDARTSAIGNLLEQAKQAATHQVNQSHQQQQQQPPSEVILESTDALYQKGTWDKSPIVIEKYKLVFFSVPKVGCTAFKQLFRRMMGYSNWQDHQYYTMPFLPHNPDTNGLKYLSDYDMTTANNMLVSDEWTRAIFVRDPKERLLSGYLDKAVYSHGSYIRMQCCGRLQRDSEPWNSIQCATGNQHYVAPKGKEENAPILPFLNFVRDIVPACNDPHWEPQHTRMAPKYWNRINFVGRFENLHEDTKRLLEQLGAWEEYGASGWKSKNGLDGAIFDPSQQAQHGTKAQDQSSKEKYFTPEVLYWLVKHYINDYEHPLLGFQKPEVNYVPPP